MRSARAPREPGASDPGHRRRDRVGVAVAPAVVDAVEGHALGVEQHGRAAEIEAAREGLRELVADDALAAQDARACPAAAARAAACPGAARGNVAIRRDAVFVLAHECFPADCWPARALRQAMAALAPSRFRISLNSRDSAVSVVSIVDVRLERLPAAPARMPAMSRLRLMACLVSRTACVSFAAMRRPSASASSQQACGRHDAIDEAHVAHFRGAHAVVAREQQIASPAWAREPGQEQRDDAAAELHLGLAEAAIVRRDREVAGDGEFHARCRGNSRARRRSSAFGQSQKRMMMRKSFSSARRTSAGSGPGPRRRPCRGRSRRRMRARRRDDDRAHGVVGLGRVERAVERLDHRTVDRIQLVRPVERQQRDGAGARERTSGSATISLP